jgi:hypothetical protein
MIICTTLKQKDLAAVSAQKLMAQSENGPDIIRRYDYYSIAGDVAADQLISAVHAGGGFFNPNKHVLLSKKSQINENQVFFHVVRRTPINCLNYVRAINDWLKKPVVSHIFQSELWGFFYERPLMVAPNVNEVMVSTPNGIAPFAHPLIHQVSKISLNQIQFANEA